MAVFAVLCFTIGRSPRGERGLKSRRKPARFEMMLSLPSRGAWIEIQIHLDRGGDNGGRSPRGERGLKFLLVKLV